MDNFFDPYDDIIASFVKGTPLASDEIDLSQFKVNSTPIKEPTNYINTEDFLPKTNKIVKPKEVQPTNNIASSLEEQSVDEPEIAKDNPSFRLLDEETPTQEIPVISQNIEESPLQKAIPEMVASMASAPEVNPELSKWYQVQQALSSFPRQNLESDKLQQLREQRDKKQALMTMLAGLNQGLGTAMSAYGAKVGSGLEPIEAAMKQAENPVKDYELDQKSKLEMLKAKLASTKSDKKFKPEIRDYQMKDGSIRPFIFDSNIGERGALFDLDGKIVPWELVQRGFAKRLYKDDLTEEHRVFDAATARTQPLGNNQSSSQSKIPSSNITNNEINTEKTPKEWKPRQRTEIEQSRKDTPEDVKQLKEALTKSGAIEELHNLMGKGNSISTASFSGLYTRLFEKGVLTDQDVTRYVTSPKLAQGIKDWINKKLQGVPSNMTQNELYDVLKAIKSAYHHKINEYTIKEALRLKDSWRRSKIEDNMSTLEVIQQLEPRFMIPPNVFSVIDAIKEERSKLKQLGQDPNNISQELKNAYNKIKADGYLELIPKKQN